MAMARTGSLVSVLVAGALLALPAAAAVPPPSGPLACAAPAVTDQATLSEIRFSGNTTEFVELAITEDGVTTAGWNLCLVANNINPPICIALGVGDFHLDPERTTDDSGNNGPFAAASFLFHDFASPNPNSTYGEFALLDDNDQVIDSIRYCKDATAAQCTSYWEVDAACATFVEHGNSNLKGIARTSTGEWVESADPTAGTSNEPPTLDHYRISHDGDGVTCLGEQVAVAAVSNEGGAFAVAAGSVLTLTTDAATPRGGWSLIAGGGTLSDPDPDDGSASYTWPGGESAVTLLFDYPVLVDGDSDSFTFDVSDGGGRSEVSGAAGAGDDPAITFANAGFVFRNLSAASNTVPTQIAGKPSDLAPGAADLALWAVRTDTGTGACSGLFPDGGDVAVELGSVCDDPGSCQAGVRVEVGNNGTTTAIANPQNQAAGSDYSDVVLRFATDSMAPLVVAYPDAGAITLRARHPILRDDGSPSGAYVSGASNRLVVRPFAFDLDFNLDSDGDGLFDDVVADRASNGTAGTSYAADAGGSRFVMAGAAFQVAVTAVAWSAADDGDGDGLADSGADLTDNPVTPNFGQEATPATVNLGHTLHPAMPADAIPGSLSGAAVGGFSAGQALALLRWDEVGILDLAARFGDTDGAGSDAYLSAAVDLANAPPLAAPVAGQAAGVGRFYPARLVLKANSPAFADTCSAGATPFTYLGQGAADPSQGFDFATPPVISVLAQQLGESDAGAFAWNYRGPFWKLHASTGNPVTLHRDYVDRVDPADPTFFLPFIDSGAAALLTFDGDPNDGRTPPQLVPDGDRFAYTRRATPQDPFAADVDLVLPAFEDDNPALARNLIDSDGACFDPTAYDAAADAITGPATTCNYDAAPGNQDGLTVAAIGGAQLRYGQPHTRGTYGTTAAVGSRLTADLEARYFDSTLGGFVTHQDDACTTVQFCKSDSDVTTSLERTDGVALPPAGGVYGPLTLGYDPARPGQADVVALLTADAGAIGGRTTLFFAGCGSGWPAWLPDPAPASLVFGIYRGDDRILHWQERR
jgi:hypothetical protein